MAAITKKETRLKLEFVINTDHSLHAGLVAVEAMARRFDLWRKLRQFDCVDPRRDKQRGYGPEVIIGPLLYALCSGGGCLSDSETLNEDRPARELFGVSKFADQSQVGQWLREQSEASVTALRQLLREFVAWVWQQADPRRIGLPVVASNEAVIVEPPVPPPAHRKQQGRSPALGLMAQEGVVRLPLCLPR
jgi:hypothetical protein